MASASLARALPVERPKGANYAGISPEARQYALRQLAVRAGVDQDFFRSWRVETEETATTIYVRPGTQRRIRFKHAARPFWEDLKRRDWRTARAGWMCARSGPESASNRDSPDLVVPFASEVHPDKQPLFRLAESDCVECHLDLLASTVLILSRFEETVVSARDAHGRFSAGMSLAGCEGYLDRPIVDEYGLALEQALACLVPAWAPRSRRLHIKLSHDIDTIGMPFKLRATAGHILRRGNPRSAARDLLSFFPGVLPAYLDCVQRLAKISLERRLRSAFYWKASPRTALDSGYDPRRPKVRKLVSWLQECGFEMGAHPGYETFRNPGQLAQEVAVMREVLGNQPFGGRQHYLRWCPETWMDWERCGLHYDSSVGYADQIGFRAGTSYPYRPWLLEENRECTLIEIPLIVMDCTLLYGMGLRPEEGLRATLDCVARCEKVGGVFTLLWHNDTLLNPSYQDLYGRILDRLQGHAQFDWRDSCQLACPDGSAN